MIAFSVRLAIQSMNDVITMPNPQSEKNSGKCTEIRPVLSTILHTKGKP